MSNLENPLCYSDCCRHSERSEESFNLKFTEEFGLIPNDWEVRNLGEVCKIGHGKDYKNEKFGDIPVFGTGGYMTSINSYLYDGETVCIGRKGTIDKPFYYSGKIWTVDTLFYTYDFQNVLPKYLYYTFCMVNWLSKNEASGVPSLTERIISATNILLPPLPEQEKIAEVLSDVDSLIDKTLGLINKKKDLKTATMQKLLTPKDDWECKTLGECSKICTGNENNENKIEEGLYPFFVRSENIERINTYSYDGEAILIPGEGGIGKIFHYINGKFNYHQRVYKISDFKYIDGKYAYYYMKKNFGKYALSNTVKATVDSLRLPIFEEFIISCPSIVEQQKIATILSDMDLEIETLEKELGKYQDLKMGMMQQLLTGQVRLLS